MSNNQNPRAHILKEYIEQFAPNYSIGWFEKNRKTGQTVNRLIDALGYYEKILDDDGGVSNKEEEKKADEFAPGARQERQFLNAPPRARLAYQQHSFERDEALNRLTNTAEAMESCYNLLPTYAQGGTAAPQKTSQVSEYVSDLLRQNLSLRWQAAKEERRAIEVAEVALDMRHDFNT